MKYFLLVLLVILFIYASIQCITYNINHKDLEKYSKKRNHFIIRLTRLNELIRIDPEDEDLIHERERIIRELNSLDEKYKNLKT